MLFMEEIIDENAGNDHVEEEEMQIRPPMNNFHDDDFIFDDIILAAFRAGATAPRRV